MAMQSVANFWKRDRREAEKARGVLHFESDYCLSRCV